MDRVYKEFNDFCGSRDNCVGCPYNPIDKSDPRAIFTYNDDRDICLAYFINDRYVLVPRDEMMITIEDEEE